MIDSVKTAIERLESAMQLTMQVPCDCDRSVNDVCSGECVGGRLWSLIHEARKYFGRENATSLDWLPVEDAERLTMEGKLGKGVYCLPLFRDSLAGGEEYIGMSLIVYNRGAWRNPYTHEVVPDVLTEGHGVSHFAIMPIFPLR